MNHHAGSIMATTLHMPTFVLGIVVLLYLASFVVLAIIRIVTGVSIQRVGYLSLRRISYEPKDGIKVEIRKLGLVFRRPTYAQPAWLSFVIADSQVTVDLREEGATRHVAGKHGEIKEIEGGYNEKKPERRDGNVKESRQRDFGEALQKLKRLAEKARKLVRYLRLVDIVIRNATFVVKEVGSISIGSTTIMADTRREVVDRSRLFDHSIALRPDQKPVEIRLTTKSVLFTPDGKASHEILDHCITNAFGVIEGGLDGVKDSAMTVKLGRVSIAYDDLLQCLSKFKGLTRQGGRTVRGKDMTQSLGVIMEEMAIHGSRTERMAEALMEWKELLQSLLEGIKEIQFAIGHLVMRKELQTVQPAGKPLHLNITMKELGMDIYRLDQTSPAHLMYFSPNDLAHQALLAAISISVTVDDRQGNQDRLVYIPMVTMTSRTTLPSKTIQFVEKSDSDRNTNILYANAVVTSPSIDLEPRHVPLVLTLLYTKPKSSRSGPQAKAQLISKLLPKANIKFSIQEPVIRIVLPRKNPIDREVGKIDMLISSMSSISADAEALHTADGQSHYSLSSSLRVASHSFYYQSASGDKHELLLTENLDVRAHIHASPEVHVVANAYLDTFIIRLIRPEIVQGIKQMVSQLRRNIRPNHPRLSEPIESQNFVRNIPSWLNHFTFEGRDFVIEVAGTDEHTPEQIRGAAVQLESWAIDYKCQKTHSPHRAMPRRRAASRAIYPEEALEQPKSPNNSKNPTDGRTVSIQLRGLDCFVVESPETTEQDPFITIPQFNANFMTSTEADGQPQLNVVANLKRFLLNYSLYRHYCIIVAATVIKETFSPHTDSKQPSIPASTLPTKFAGTLYKAPENMLLKARTDGNIADSPIPLPEFISIDIKIRHFRMKAFFPQGPSIMFEVFELDAGHRRWGFPFIKSQGARLYSESPTVKHSWARLITIRHMEIDFRDHKRKTDGIFKEESSIDFAAEAVRLAIPHQFILYRVTDNIINATKASQQIHRRLKTETNEGVPKRHAQVPKMIPKISVRTKALLFELEDDPFETRLALIYRVGLSEQKMRLAREAAFDAKVQKIEDNERKKLAEYSASRANSGMSFNEQRSRFRVRSKTMKSEKGSQPTENRRRANSNTGRRQMRYDPASASGPSDSAAVSKEEARRKLDEHNSATWIRRIRWAQELMANKVADKRNAFWSTNDIPSDIEETETILSIPNRPALMAAYFHGVDLVFDRPSFPLSELPDFLHRVGKGLPRDTKFSLLVPFGIKLDFSEAKIHLRDYPLPFIHVPQMASDQTTRAPSWSLSGDLVVAEELRNSESMRDVRVDIIPPDGRISEHGKISRFSINVQRPVSPVKSYSDIKVAINTSYPTRITWCTSYQPAIQDMMMVFETFTKPHFDPSERTGFWDKIRLVLHSMIQLNWKGDGDVHLTIKGSRDPYKVTGDGAGFAFCWRGDVSWDLGVDNDPKKFMKVEADEFILAIPDFTHQAREELDTPNEDRSVASSSSYKEGALFKKVIMKLSGKVKFLVGLIFEQDLGGAGDWKERKRSFDFKPHYEVTLKTPQHAKASAGAVYDAFKGFRSHYIHLSLAVIAPIDRDWTLATTKPSSSYNTIHLTPRFFTHFFSWWRLFAANMSLPIRQGVLWPGPEKSSKKFGRHLATIKYQLLLSPIFITHMYKHKLSDESDRVAATGLKVKLDTLLFDMHMRREEVTTAIKGLNQERKSFGMRINQAELDLHSADIRAVSATMDESTVADLKHAAEEPMSSAQGTIRFSGDLSQFSISDSDYSWVDMDDFVELDWVLPSDKTPSTMIVPLAFAPRFTYFRQTDHSHPDCDDIETPSTFGHEDTHDCVMSQNNDPHEIQCGLVQSRLEKVHFQMNKNKEALQELAIKIKSGPDDEMLRVESGKLIEQSSVLFNKIKFLESMLRRMSQRLEENSSSNSSQSSYAALNSEAERENLATDSTPVIDYASDFDNRFIVHNMQAKWSNTLRNIIIRYIHQVNQRRGFVYYMSRRAVKFILDIVEEQTHSDYQQSSKSPVQGPSSTPTEDLQSIESRLQKLLDDPVKFVIANENGNNGNRSFLQTLTTVPRDLAADVSEDYLPLNSYHVRLIAPQIQLQSEKNKSAALLVTTQGMQLKVVSIMDKERLGDEVSGLVQRRFLLTMENAQFFVSHQKEFASQSMWLHSANRYGAPTGSSWPPWVPLENMFDFERNPVGFSRVVERTSAMLRYDKHNSLRLKYSDQVSGGDSTTSSPQGTPLDEERRLDHVWVNFPKVKALCDSAQYYAMYIIVLDLLLYTEPAEKLRSEKLEKIMLASDFSDLRGAPEMVECLQNRISQLQEIKLYFQVHARDLDDKGWEDYITINNDLNNCEDELFFMMKAITTAQRRYEDKGSQTSGLIRWNLSANEIIWHLLREQRESLMDIMFTNATYERIDNADGSNFNTVEVEMMQGFNQLPNAAYPEMIAPFIDHYRLSLERETRPMRILRVYWHMLEAIAGIPVMDHFEVNLFPLKIQLEREIGDKVFEYIFPGVRSAEDEGVSPFIVNSHPDEDEEESDSDDENRSDTVIEERIPKDGRLRSTLTIPERPSTSASSERRDSSFGFASTYEKSIRSFMPSKTPANQTANESPSVKPRKSSDSALPTLQLPLTSTAEKSRRRQLFHRNSSSDKQEKPSDELSQMIRRASNYMTLAYIKIPSVTLCLSYKGRGDRNIEDIHEFVFRMPMLEYRNKTWSNLDLALRLKKDIMKALISHTGAILENKITKHRPERPHANLLRMMANNSTIGTSPAKFMASEGDLTLRGATTLPGDPLSIYRSTISSGGSVSSSVPSTASSSASKTAGTNSSNIMAPPRENENRGGFLNRRLSQLTNHPRSREVSGGDESEESIKKKKNLLLGKVFGAN